MAHEHLAGKIDALAAVLEAAVGNATDKDGAFPAAGTTQGVCATTTGVVAIGLTCATISTTDGC
jgi:hypothetical protein